MTAAADVRNDNCLPPPQPPDKAGTRPKFNLQSMLVQVRKVQGFLAGERERKRKMEEEWEKAKGLVAGKEDEQK